MNYLGLFQNPLHDFPYHSPAISYDHTLFSHSSFGPSPRPFDHLIRFSHTCSSLCFDFRALSALCHTWALPPLRILDHRSSSAASVSSILTGFWLIGALDCISGTGSRLIITLMLRRYFITCYCPDGPRGTRSAQLQRSTTKSDQGPGTSWLLD